MVAAVRGQSGRGASAPSRAPAQTARRKPATQGPTKFRGAPPGVGLSPKIALMGEGEQVLAHETDEGFTVRRCSRKCLCGNGTNLLNPGTRGRAAARLTGSAGATCVPSAAPLPSVAAPGG